MRRACVSIRGFQCGVWWHSVLMPFVGPKAIPKYLSSVRKGIAVGLILFIDGLYWLGRSIGSSNTWHLHSAYIAFILAAFTLVVTGIYAMRSG